MSLVTRVPDRDGVRTLLQGFRFTTTSKSEKWAKRVTRRPQFDSQNGSRTESQEWGAFSDRVRQSLFSGPPVAVRHEKAVTATEYPRRTTSSSTSILVHSAKRYDLRRPGGGETRHKLRVTELAGVSEPSHSAPHHWPLLSDVLDGPVPFDLFLEVDTVRQLVAAGKQESDGMGGGVYAKCGVIASLRDRRAASQ